MEWERAWREERAALMRLVVLLNAFAGLADRAAGRSAVIRGIVLWILRRAEPVARDFVIGDEDMLPDQGFWPMAPAAAGNRPEDALHLAEIFRMLAWLLEAQIGPLGTHADGRAGGPGDHPVRVAAEGKTLAVLAALTRVALARPHRVAAPDTS